MKFQEKTISAMAPANQKTWGRLKSRYEEIAGKELKATGKKDPTFELDEAVVKEMRSDPRMNKGLRIFSRSYNAASIPVTERSVKGRTTPATPS